MIIIFGWLLLEVARNAYIIKVLKRDPDHSLNFVIRVLPLLLLYWQFILNPSPDWQAFGRAVLAFVFVFWFLFDTLLNVVRGQKPWHLGTHYIDQLQVKYGGEFPWFVWKALLFLFAMANYFMDPVTGILR